MGVLRTGVEATMTGAAGRAAGAATTAAAGALAATFDAIDGVAVALRAMVESFPNAGGGWADVSGTCRRLGVCPAPAAPRPLGRGRPAPRAVLAGYAGGGHEHSPLTSA